MKDEKLLVERIIPHPFVVGEIIFLSSKLPPKEKVFRMIPDEEKLAQVRKELKEISDGTR